MNGKQRGAMSLEMMIVVVIVIVLFGWAISRTDMLRSRTSTLTEASNLITLGEEVRSLLKSAGNYGTSGSDLVPGLISNNGVPRNINVSGSTIVNDYGGTVLITSTGAGFTMTDPNLPTDVCAQTAMKVSATNGFTSLSINGNSAVSGAMSATTAASACNQSGNANSIVLNSAS